MKAISAQQARQAATSNALTPNEQNSLDKIMQVVNEAVKYKLLETTFSIPYGCNQRVYDELTTLGYELAEGIIPNFLKIKW